MGRSPRPIARRPAALATLALNPRASGDVGWQLSFAAVIGILLWASRLRDLLIGGPRRQTDWLAACPGRGRRRHHLGDARHGAVDGERVRRGVDRVAARQPSRPAGGRAHDVAGDAGLHRRTGARDTRAATHLARRPPGGLRGPGGALARLARAGRAWRSAPRASARSWPPMRRSASARGWLWAGPPATRSPRWHPAVTAAVGRRGGRRPRRRSPSGRPSPARRRGGPDARPADHGPRRRPGRLDSARSGRRRARPGGRRAPTATSFVPTSSARASPKLAAVVVTHDQSDHVGGIEELLGVLPIRRLLYAQRGPDFPRDARAAGVRTSSIAEGSEVDSGGLRLEVLWPPRAALDDRAPGGSEPTALVLLARWHRFSMLLTADAEAEAVPLDPGPVDVLKVAHHGSDDAGLGRAARPRRAEPGGDLGRLRQPLWPSDAGHPFHPRRASRPQRSVRTRRAT